VPRTALLWYRRDLRLHDHPALHAAVAAADRVVPLFILDPGLLQGRWPAPNRVRFMLDSLAALRDDLAARGAPLVVLRGRPAEVLPGLAAAIGARDVFATRDVSPYARARDGAVGVALEAVGATLHLRGGALVAEPEEVAGGDGRPLSVFTPYLRRWEGIARRDVLPVPHGLRGIAADAAARLPGVVGLPDQGSVVPTADPALLLVPGEAAARARLAAWASDARLAGYAVGRDRLGIEGTSRLSADLRWGLVSPLAVLDATGGPGDGRAAFARELAWRDFYAQVLWYHPHVTQTAFRSVYERVPWRADAAAFDAWREGRTGYPVVDAAMRQLAASGWMHNRARMIAASFLAKDLLIDWRRGEQHFMEHLVDGDVAANNGGWQWAAGTGTDAQPYFRVFNPVAQGERHDPDGSYVRRWIPELAGVPDRFVQAPWTMPSSVQATAGCAVGRDYPSPIVDHAWARARALAAYASTRVPAPAQRPASRA
jgi:deoxyribodipyrimidine photo-lyase